LLGGLRLNNNQTRQSWLNNPTDLTDQRVAVRSQIRKYKTQPKPKFPWLFSTNKIKQCSCSLFLFVFVTVFSFIIRLDVSNPNQFPSNFVRLSCFMIQRQRLFSKTCGSVFNLNSSFQPINSFLRWNPSRYSFAVNCGFPFYVWNDSEMFHFSKNGIFNRWQIQFRNNRRTMSFSIKQNQFFKHVNIPCVQFVRVCGNNISTTFASLWVFHFFLNKKIKTLLIAGFINTPQVFNPVCFQILFVTFFHDFLQIIFYFRIGLCCNKYFNVVWIVWFNKFDFIDVYNISWYFHELWSVL
jgi:hypothetical protein